MRPATSTSIAKTVAASGVRKSPAKPAAMPMSKNVLPGSWKVGVVRSNVRRLHRSHGHALASRAAAKEVRSHVLNITSGTRRGRWRLRVRDLRRILSSCRGRCPCSKCGRQTRWQGPRGRGEQVILLVTEGANRQKRDQRARRWRQR